MEQLEIFPVPSPCKGICQTDNQGYCIGCFRSRDERFHWQTLSDPEKHQVLMRCQRRAKTKTRQVKAQPISLTPQPVQASLFD
ncbi:DUF1289 domain-containing protein [Algicola sagamiensis]|uniref:DUF1289 domain-containing protein n=1 Tax=Algicola sagamiensis TaxID=163869 RepID=UPI000381F9C1|nr:DUF1289 domain-containing protein [Algicola sagamiensis]